MDGRFSSARFFGDYQILGSPGSRRVGRERMGERINFYSGPYSEIYNFYGLCSTIIFRIIDFGRILYIISIVSLFVAIAIIRYVRSSTIAGKTRILHIETTELRRFTR